MWDSCCIQSSPVWSIIYRQYRLHYPFRAPWWLRILVYVLRHFEPSSFHYWYWCAAGKHDELDSVKKSIDCTSGFDSVNKPKEFLIILQKRTGKVFFIGKSYTLLLARWWHWERDPVGIVGAGLEARGRFNCPSKGRWYGWGSGIGCAEESFGKMRSEAAGDEGFLLDCELDVLRLRMEGPPIRVRRSSTTSNLWGSLLSTIHKY